MTFTTQDLDNLLSVLGLGPQNALTAEQIATRLGYPTGGNQVKTRALITFAIESEYLIKSSTANPSGYWISDNKQEMSEYIESLRNRADHISERAENLRSTWNTQNPDDTI